MAKTVFNKDKVGRWRSIYTANKNTKLEKAKNGVFYLPKGIYTLKIGDEKATFEIK